VDFNIDNLLQKITNPPLVTENESYLLKFAENDDEIFAAQKLRYRVFNCEQNRGLDSANDAEFDRDEFDEGAAHLIVFDKATGAPIGTYRAIGQPDNDPEKMYSAREYEVDGIGPYVPRIIEVGRSCVDKDYRNGAVVAILWNGMAAITLRSGCRYLCGCVSLEDAQPAVAWALYESLCEKGLCFPGIHFKPRPQFSFPRPDGAEIEKIRNDKTRLRAAMPPLMKGYFTIGAKLLGEPAFDYEFGSIDLPVMVDMWRLPDRYHRHFFPNITFPED
jgi:putative hemolysin